MLLPKKILILCFCGYMDDVCTLRIVYHIYAKKQISNLYEKDMLVL